MILINSVTLLIIRLLQKVIAPGILLDLYIKCEHIYVSIRLHIKSGDILGIT